MISPLYRISIASGFPIATFDDTGGIRRVPRFQFNQPISPSVPFGPRHQSRSLDATAAECHLHGAQLRPEQRIGGFAQLHGGALVHTSYTLNGDLTRKHGFYIGSKWAQIGG